MRAGRTSGGGRRLTLRVVPNDDVHPSDQPESRARPLGVHPVGLAKASYTTNASGAGGQGLREPGSGEALAFLSAWSGERVLEVCDGLADRGLSPLVSRSALSIMKSWITPSYRVALTSTPASRSLRP